MHQTHANLEVLIVDDCSTDGQTWAKIQRWAKRDERIRVLRTPANSGTYIAKNLALPLASGELITFHDSDDWAHPMRLAQQAAAILHGDRMIASQSQWVKATPDGLPILKNWGSYVYSNPASLMIRREVVHRLGGFDTVRIGADTEFIARVKCVFGSRSFAAVEQLLTVGTQRLDALTSSGVGEIDADGYNEVRSAYGYAWRRWHVEIASGQTATVQIDRKTAEPFALPAEMQPSYR